MRLDQRFDFQWPYRWVRPHRYQQTATDAQPSPAVMKRPSSSKRSINVMLPWCGSIPLGNDISDLIVPSQRSSIRSEPLSTFPSGNSANAFTSLRSTRPNLPISPLALAQQMFSPFPETYVTHSARYQATISLRKFDIVNILSKGFCAKNNLFAFDHTVSKKSGNIPTDITCSHQQRNSSSCSPSLCLSLKYDVASRVLIHHNVRLRTFLTHSRSFREG